MVAAYRREAILTLANEGSELSVDEIARHFDVSRETVRRDLKYLQSHGLLRRVHGGALPAQTGWEAAFRERLVDNAPAKQGIARAAARLFRENDTLMIDTGTTTSMLAAELAHAPRLTVITNSFDVASRLGVGSSQHRIHVIGGEFRSESQQTLGSACLEQISRYRADHAIISCGGADPVDGLMDYDFEDAMVARAMIAQAARLTLIADRTKFERVAMAKVCGLDLVDRIVTDAEPPPWLREAADLHQTELIIA